MREPGMTRALGCKLQECKAKMKDRLKTVANSDLEKEEEAQRCMALKTCRMGMTSYGQMGVPMRWSISLYVP